jgi:hypothetical protein
MKQELNDVQNNNQAEEHIEELESIIDNQKQ